MPLTEFGDQRQQDEFLDRMTLSDQHSREDVDQLVWMVRHWMNNHKVMRDRCALLTQRPDLPVDRLPAFRQLVRLQEQNTNIRTLLRDTYEGATQR